MSHRRFCLHLPASLLLAAALVSVSLAQTAKRPLNHKDYDGWRSISSQHISGDGHFLAYGLFPQEGDGEVVVRNLVTGQETRHPAGMRPAPALAANPEEGPAPEARGVTIEFSADSRTLVFSTFPSKADTDKARKEKKTGDQAPKDGIVIVDLASGHATRIERVKRFEMPEKASGYLAYLREGTAGPPAANPPAEKNPVGEFADQQGRGGRGGRGGGGGRGARAEFGSDLVLRTVADGAERTFSDVVEFSLTEDGKQLVYVVSAHDTSKNGVFALALGSAAAPTVLAAGKGKYSKLTWDENQTQLAFLTDRDDAAAKQPKWTVYRWDRQSPAASETVSAATPGFRQEYVLSDKGNLSFSRDGGRIFFGVALPPPPEKKADDVPDDDKAHVELWSYKDDYIEPIQKVRAERDRNRTFMAAYVIGEKKVVQLADSELSEITPTENARWVLGSDDRAYRKADDYDERYSDAWIVDSTTGARKLMIKKDHGQVIASPSGRYLLTFDGKDWSTVSVPDGKVVNLTAGLPVKFWNEETDTPSTPGAYGQGGWTKDGSAVLLYDEYDIWKVAPDGSGAHNLTNGYGRKHDLRLRYVREAADPRDRWIDPAQPLLLHAENLKTWESGFFRGSWTGADPKQLLMGAKFFSQPVKAKNADVYLLTAQSFKESPGPGNHRRHFQGAAQSFRRQSAAGAHPLGNL